MISNQLREDIGRLLVELGRHERLTLLEHRFACALGIIMSVCGALEVRGGIDVRVSLHRYRAEMVHRVYGESGLGVFSLHLVKDAR